MRNILFFTVLFILLCSCRQEPELKSDPISKNNGERKMGMQITSSAFEDGQLIPPRFTADGANVSPSLEWQGIPEGTKSFALINDDPDAPMGTWVHWVIYNIPASVTNLTENIPPDEVLDDGTKQGTNDFGRIGYGGPAPPSGTHRYYFKIYALDTILDITPGATKTKLESAMKDHILAKAQLMGKYRR